MQCYLPLLPLPCFAMIPMQYMLSLMCAGGSRVEECSTEGCTTLALYYGVCFKHMADADIVVKGAPCAAASLEINVERDEDAKEDITDSRPVIASLHP